MKNDFPSFYPPDRCINNFTASTCTIPFPPSLSVNTEQAVWGWWGGGGGGGGAGYRGRAISPRLVSFAYISVESTTTMQRSHPISHTAETLCLPPTVPTHHYTALLASAMKPVCGCVVGEGVCVSKENSMHVCSTGLVIRHLLNLHIHFKDFTTTISLLILHHLTNSFYSGNIVT